MRNHLIVCFDTSHSEEWFSQVLKGQTKLYKVSVMEGGRVYNAITTDDGEYMTYLSLKYGSRISPIELRYTELVKWKDNHSD